jgi:L-fuculose-phosphate aldolase
MTDNELREELAKLITELYHAGLVTATGGNLSVRSSSNPDTAWITPSAIFKGDLTADQMILIDMEGKKISGESKPSVESIYHAGIMKYRPEVNAVVHTHAPLSTIFGMCDMEILPVTMDAVFSMSLPVIPFYIGGSKELADEVIENVGKTKAMGAFLRNHGLMTVGKSLRKAADFSYMIEDVVDILIRIKTANLTPSLLPQEAIDLLSQYAGTI